MLDHVRTDLGVAVHAVVVLGRDEHGAQRDGATVDVLEGDLGLRVGAEVRDGSGLADLGEALRHAMCEVDGQRHEHVGLVAGVAEHHPLVAGALLVELVVLAGTAGAHLFGVVDPLGDVGRLLVDRDHDAARVPVVAEALAVVADVADGATHRRGDVHVGIGGDLSCDDRQPGGDHGLAGHPGLGVLGEDRVEDGVRDLVGHLVGVTLGHRFRGEGPTAHVCSPGGRSGEGRRGAGSWRDRRCSTTASSTASATAALSVSGTW